MKKDILKIYADKKAEVEKLEAEIKELQPKVMEVLDKDGVLTLREEYGTFSVVLRKKWTYSKALTEKEKQYDAIIKAAKADEQTLHVKTANLV